MLSRMGSRIGGGSVVEVPVSLVETFREAAARRGVSLSEAICGALELWVSGVVSEGSGEGPVEGQSLILGCSPEDVASYEACRARLAADPFAVCDVLDETKEALSEAFGFSLARVVRSGQEEPVFSLETGVGKVFLGPESNILDQQRFRELVFMETGFSVPECGAVEWVDRSTALLHIAEQVRSRVGAWPPRPW